MVHWAKPLKISHSAWMLAMDSCRSGFNSRSGRGFSAQLG